MSLAVSQCVYSQIQKYSLAGQRKRYFWEQLVVFTLTRAFDVGLATAAAVAAVAAGAHASGVPLTAGMLQHAAVGGALKSGAMSFAGVVMLAPHSAPFVVLPMLLGTSIASNVLLVAALANRIMGYAPTQLLVAAVVASVPLSFCIVYYYGAFRVPVTLISIAFDVLGAYTLVKMADNLGYPISPPRPAMVAGAVFGTVYSVAITLLGCCVIGKSRTFYIFDTFARGHTNGTAYAGCCGNRVRINVHTTEIITGPGVSGSTNSFTTGTVQNSFHGFGLYWDPGAVNGGVSWSASRTRDFTTTSSNSHATAIRYTR